MSNKQDEHWCDNRYNKKDGHFVIGELAEKIFRDLENYFLHDLSKTLTVTENDIQKEYIIDKLKSILHTAEQIELYVKDANSIYAVYGVDYEMRRRRWLTARGYSFQLVAQLTHISDLTVNKTNIQKYANISTELYTLAEKIKNIMEKDDMKKKKYCKEYFKET